MKLLTPMLPKNLPSLWLRLANNRLISGKNNCITAGLYQTDRLF